MSGAVSNAAGKVVQKPEISVGPRAVGFVPMVLAGGGVGDTHKLDNAYPLGAGPSASSGQASLWLAPGSGQWVCSVVFSFGRRGSGRAVVA